MRTKKYLKIALLVVIAALFYLDIYIPISEVPT